MDLVSVMLPMDSSNIVRERAIAESQVDTDRSPCVDADRCLRAASIPVNGREVRDSNQSPHAEMPARGRQRAREWAIARFPGKNKGRTEHKRHYRTLRCGLAGAPLLLLPLVCIA